VLGFFEIGFCELLAQAGLEPQSSWSLPSKYLGLQAWATGAWHFACFWDSVLLCSSGWPENHYVAAQDGLELAILLSQPPKCWDYRCVLLCQAPFSFK
jgi:hypothetical protein